MKSSFSQTANVGCSWGTEQEAASALRAFFGAGFTPGVFVMPTYPSRAVVKEASVAVVKAVKNSFEFL